MISSMQRDAKNILTSTRNRSKNPLAAASEASQTNPLSFKINSTEPAKLTFGQDFLLEHCLPVHQITSIKVKGGVANPYKDLQESPQSYGFPC